ncbi:flagellar basal body rod C-terminal domain-containing protein [Desulfothermus okinawensis JCM 13304]
MNNISSINALHAYGIRQQVNANNVANVNTPDFKPSRVDMEEGDNRSGVRVQDIRKQENELRTQKNGNERETEKKNAPSETDLVTEFTQMLENKNAYNANAQMIKTNDQMNGEIINKLA